MNESFAPVRTRSVTSEDLKQTELFKDMKNEAALKRLAKYSWICELDERQPLHLKRNGVEYIYAIIEGHIEVRIASEILKGKRYKDKKSFLAWRGRGQVLGEMKAIADEKNNAELTTHGVCTMIEIPSALLTKVADKNAVIYKNLARLIADKTFHERQRVELIQIHSRELHRKFAHMLLIFLEERGYEQCDNGKRIKGIFTHDDLAAYIGTTRSSASNYLGSFKREKIIDYSNGSYIILNEKALKEIASPDSKYKLKSSANNRLAEKGLAKVT